jgi:hypothetical protein
MSALGTSVASSSTSPDLSSATTMPVRNKEQNQSIAKFTDRGANRVFNMSHPLNPHWVTPNHIGVG